MQGDGDIPTSSPTTENASEADQSRPARPIADLLTDPEFPRSAMGEWVDIGGYTGVVVDVVKQSLKVKSAEGITMSFNANGLRRIYGRTLPPEPPPPIPEPPAVRPPKPASVRSQQATAPPPPQAPPPPPAIEPNFDQPVKSVKEFVGRADFPACVLGQHVEVGGYTGVVVQIINKSLKVRSRSETTRSYNADALRKLFGHA